MHFDLERKLDTDDIDRPTPLYIMRATRVLRATARTGLRYLEPGQPTGLTGLLTHKSPRAALVNVYSSTLEKLQQMPQSSVYRQSTEALTRHRLAIVEAAKPDGIEAWQEAVREVVKRKPELFEVPKSSTDPTMVEYVERLQVKSPEELPEGEDMYTHRETLDDVADVGPEPQLSLEQ